MGAPQFRRGTIGQKAVQAEEKTPTPGPVDTSNIRKNKFGAKCVNCGVFVPENTGRLEKNNGKWEVSHIPPCPDVATDVAAQPEVQHEPNVFNGETLYDGIYTYETLTAHRTFRLRTQGLDDDFMPGAQIVQHLTGPDNDTDYQSIGHIKGSRLYVWKKHQDKVTLVKDLEEFLKDPQDALKSTSCYRCGRTLTVPASVYNGLGPECAKKGL